MKTTQMRLKSGCLGARGMLRRKNLGRASERGRGEELISRPSAMDQGAKLGGIGANS